MRGARESAEVLWWRAQASDQRFAGHREAGIEGSVGSVGDSYDNALAEPVIGLYKTEVIRRQGPWRHVEAVEFATLAWVDWFNTRRLLEPISHVPPNEYEDAYYRRQKTLETPAMEAGVN